MTGPAVIGVDVGGTKILTGRLDADGDVLAMGERPCPTDSQDSVLAALDAAVEELLDDGVGAIGYGIPCNIDRRSGLALRATNMPLGGVDVAARARNRFGLPVGVENDGTAAALAEWKLGAGRGAQDLVMLTLGTGVGGGLVLDGSLYRGWAELGHVVVDADGPPCQGNCHGRGHLEALTSGHAAERAAQALYGPDGTAHELVARARAEEPAALAAIARMGEFLGIAIGSLVNVFDPDVVVVGGGFGVAVWDLISTGVDGAARREAITPADERLSIVPAELGGTAGLVGAGLLAVEALRAERAGG